MGLGVMADGHDGPEVEVHLGAQVGQVLPDDRERGGFERGWPRPPARGRRDPRRCPARPARPRRPRGGCCRPWRGGCRGRPGGTAAAPVARRRGRPARSRRDPRGRRRPRGARRRRSRRARARGRGSRSRPAPRGRAPGAAGVRAGSPRRSRPRGRARRRAWRAARSGSRPPGRGRSSPSPARTGARAGARTRSGDRRQARSAPARGPRAISLTRHCTAIRSARPSSVAGKDAGRAARSLGSRPRARESTSRAVRDPGSGTVRSSSGITPAILGGGGARRRACGGPS